MAGAASAAKTVTGHTGTVLRGRNLACLPLSVRSVDAVEVGPRVGVAERVRPGAERLARVAAFLRLAVVKLQVVVAVGVVAEPVGGVRVQGGRNRNRVPADA